MIKSLGAADSRIFRASILPVFVSALANFSLSAPSAAHLKEPKAKPQSASERIYEEAEQIFQKATSTHYRHNKLPASEQLGFADGTECSVDTDCSGFVSYVLNKVAAPQYEPIRRMQIDRAYPQAKSFALFFKQLSDTSASSGWQRVSKYSDLKRGDLIAWEKPRDPGPRGNTGHVMFVVDAPAPIEVTEGKRYVSILVLDCSSVTHFAPETLPPNTHQTVRNGLGRGSIRLLLDENDNPIGYWEGNYSAEKDRQILKPSLSDNIGFARLVGE